MKRYLDDHLPGLVILSLLLVAGIFVCGHYGVAWDEPYQRELGRLNYAYVSGHDNALLSSPHRHEGPVWAMTLYRIEQSLHLSSSRSVYLTRHLANHYLYLLAGFAFYVLVYRLFRSRPLAIVGMLMLLLTPRIYAHSWFNTHDMPLLSLTICAFLAVEIAFSMGSIVTFAVAAAVCGVATGMGIAAAMVPVVAVIFLLTDLGLTLRNRARPTAIAVNTLVFTLVYAAVAYACWPYLWHHTWMHVKEAATALAQVHADGPVLFRGTAAAAGKLPACYLPVWLGITVPELWVILGVPGAVLLVVNALRQPGKYLTNVPGRNFVLYLLCFAAPVVTAICLRTMVYEDWRNLYYTYPAFLLLGLYIIHLISQVSRFIWLVCAAQLLQVAYFIVRNHPYQQVYFNNFVSHHLESLRARYDLDHTGTTVYNGLTGILERDNRGVIKVAYSVTDTPNALTNNLLMLGAAERRRFVMASEQADADYLITNFRGQPGNLPYPMLFEERVGNSSIMRVYKLR